MKRFAIIELFLMSDEAFSISCCAINHDKNGISIKDFQSDINSIDELPVYLYNKTIYLSIHGKGVLTKDVNKISGINENMSNNQTYSQIWESDNYHLLSMIHQQQLNKYLSIFKDKKLCIKQIYFGAIPLLQLINENVQVKEFSIYYYRFFINDKKNIKISSGAETEKGEFEFKHNKYPIKQSMLLAVALLVTERKEDLKITDRFDEKINLTSFFYYCRYYKLVQRSLIFILFFLLIINFLLFLNISQNNTSGSVDTFKMTKLKFKEDSLRTTLKEQEKKYKINGIKNNTSVSLLLDRILTTIPNGIKFTEINVNPSSFSREKKIFRFEQNKIMLNGSTDNSYIINKWMKQLENNKLILKSNLVSYIQESGTSSGSFILEFYYSNQWMEYINLKK